MHIAFFLFLSFIPLSPSRSSQKARSFRFRCHPAGSRFHSSSFLSLSPCAPSYPAGCRQCARVREPSLLPLLSVLPFRCHYCSSFIPPSPFLPSPPCRLPTARLCIASGSPSARILTPTEYHGQAFPGSPSAGWRSRSGGKHCS